MIACSEPEDVWLFPSGDLCDAADLYDWLVEQLPTTGFAWGELLEGRYQLPAARRTARQRSSFRPTWVAVKPSEP